MLTGANVDHCRSTENSLSSDRWADEDQEQTRNDRVRLEIHERKKPPVPHGAPDICHTGWLNCLEGSFYTDTFIAVGNKNHARLVPLHCSQLGYKWLHTVETPCI